MSQLNINIINKRAIYEADEKIVCGNDDYVIEFSFDSEWDGKDKKIARFIVWHGGRYKHLDVEFTGNRCPVPPLYNVKFVKIGVYVEGGISTTTAAYIECDEGILDGNSHNVLSLEAMGKFNEALRGEQGKSAYEVAVDNGFEGTEQEWLNSLIGGGGGTQITTDKELSETSENPVQNKAVTKRINDFYNEFSKHKNSYENAFNALDKAYYELAQQISNGKVIKSIEQTTTSTEDNGINVITVTFKDGTSTTFNIRNGSKGKDGADGYTPQKGVHYFTEADKSEMVQRVLAELPNGDEVRY